MKKIVLVLFLIHLPTLSLAEETNRYLWEDLSVNLPETRLRTFVLDPQNPDQLYVAGTNSVWKGNLQEHTWEQILNVSNQKYVVKEELKEKETKGLFQFLNESDKKKILASADFDVQARQILFLEQSFQGATHLAVDPVDSNHIFVGTFGGLFVSDDGGLSWTKVRLGIGNEEQAVLHIHISPHNPKKVYVGTLGGLFVSKNRGKRWKPLKRGIGPEPVSFILEEPHSNASLWLSVLGEGVLTTQDNGRNWISMRVGIGDQVNQVQALAISKEKETKWIFAATPKGLFCLKEGETQWEPCGRKNALGSNLNWVWVDPMNPNHLYVTGEQGLFFSKDWGKTFQQLTLGIRFQNAHQISKDKSGTIFFITTRGIYRSWRSSQSSASSTKEDSSIHVKDFLDFYWQAFLQEPPVQEVQRQAMRFAETHPEKIRSWRRRAKWRALLPRLQIGYDEARDRETDFITSAKKEIDNSDKFTLDETVITTSSFKGKRQIPAKTFSTESSIDETFDFKGSRFHDRETEFGIAAVWELGDLLYNPEEIDISKEARALAELRDDILKEVTQFYFRRRHLQIDMLTDKPIEEIEEPEQKQIALERRLRQQLDLEELTAQLDALTGSWFTSEIRKRELNLKLSAP